MTPAGLLTLFRKEMADEASPQLWSNFEICNYMNDAQEMFCRETGGVPDSTSSLTSMTIAVNQGPIALDARILKIRDAYRTSDGRQIKLVNYEDMDKCGMRFNGRTGPINSLIIGMDDDFVTPYPLASLADALKLLIDRLPLREITEDNVNSVKFEIKPHHHRHLLYWMKKLAYEKQDAETFNKSKSVEFEKKFMDYCFKAMKEKERRKHKPRSVAFGGLATRAPVSREDMDY